MPNAVPSGWASDSSLLNTLPGTPSGEVPIKSQLTYNGNTYALVTNSKGEYGVYLGGTNIFNQQIGSNALIFDAAANGVLETGTAWGRENTKTQVGGSAGLTGLKELAEKQISETYANYLTQEEKNNLQNPRISASISKKQPTPVAPGAPGDGGGSAPQPGDPDYVEGTGGTIEGLKDISAQFGQEKDKQLYSNWKDFLQYPENISSSGQDRLVISQIQYVAGDLSNTLSGSLSRREEQFDNLSQLEKLLGMVTLPMPNDISESNQVGWGEDSLSNLGAALMGAGMGVVNPFAQGKFGEASSALTNAIGALMTNEAVGTRGRQFLLANAVASIIKKGGINVNPESYISRVTGSAINPNLELLFNGPKLRAFQFGFKMSPRSAEEARNIRAILKFFKKGMSPRTSIKNENAFFLGTPNVFRIKYASSSSELGSIGKIKTCALTSFNINYTPDGFYAAYNDPDSGGSQPVSVTMQLGFVELTPVFSDDYDDSLTVGPNKFEGVTYTPESSTSSPGIELPNDLANNLPGIDLPGIGLPGINPGGR